MSPPSVFAAMKIFEEATSRSPSVSPKMKRRSTPKPIRMSSEEIDFPETIPMYTSQATAQQDAEFQFYWQKEPEIRPQVSATASIKREHKTTVDFAYATLKHDQLTYPDYATASLKREQPDVVDFDAVYAKPEPKPAPYATQTVQFEAEIQQPSEVLDLNFVSPPSIAEAIKRFESPAVTPKVKRRAPVHPITPEQPLEPDRPNWMVSQFTSAAYVIPDRFSAQEYNVSVGATIQKPDEDTSFVSDAKRFFEQPSDLRSPSASPVLKRRYKPVPQDEDIDFPKTIPLYRTPVREPAPEFQDEEIPTKEATTLPSPRCL